MLRSAEIPSSSRFGGGGGGGGRLSLPAVAVRCVMEWVVEEGAGDFTLREPVAAVTMQVSTACWPASRAKGAAMLDPRSTGSKPASAPVLQSAAGCAPSSIRSHTVHHRLRI